MAGGSAQRVVVPAQFTAVNSDPKSIFTPRFRQRRASFENPEASLAERWALYDACAAAEESSSPAPDAEDGVGGPLGKRESPVAEDFSLPPFDADEYAVLDMNEDAISDSDLRALGNVVDLQSTPKAASLSLPSEPKEKSTSSTETTSLLANPKLLRTPYLLPGNVAEPQSKAQTEDQTHAPTLPGSQETPIVLSDSEAPAAPQPKKRNGTKATAQSYAQPRITTGQQSKKRKTQTALTQMLSPAEAASKPFKRPRGRPPKPKQPTSAAAPPPAEPMPAEDTFAQTEPRTPTQALYKPPQRVKEATRVRLHSAVTGLTPRPALQTHLRTANALLFGKQAAERNAGDVFEVFGHVVGMMDGRTAMLGDLWDRCAPLVGVRWNAGVGTLLGDVSQFMLRESLETGRLVIVLGRFETEPGNAVWLHASSVRETTWDEVRYIEGIVDP